MNHEIKKDIPLLLEQSYSPFHVVANLDKKLSENGFIRLEEQNSFQLERGKKYFVKRNSSSLIAFKIPKEYKQQFKITACHTDSPTYKLKPKPFEFYKNYVSLNVEPYGGMIHHTWIDRPLTIAGRVMVNTGDNRITAKLLYLDKDLCIIPSLAIHMDRNINSNHNFNPAKDMIPLFGLEKDNAPEDFDSYLKKEMVSLGLVNDDDSILGFDLYLVNRDKPTVLGWNQEFLASGKEDDLASTYSTLYGFLEAEETGAIDVYAAFDNEEVGSLTKQGANSTFLKDTLKRILFALEGDLSTYEQTISSSFLVSIDNAHAIHPNFPEYRDSTSEVLLGKGIVIKYNANQSYTSDSYSASVIKLLCEKYDIPYQEFTNRSDLRGGSTLGNISNSEVSLTSVDIGIPQLAMHSSYEMLALEDVLSMNNLVKSYYESNLQYDNGDIIL